LNVAWNINVGLSKAISIEFSIDTEPICDYISIYGVDNNGSTFLVGTYSGAQYGTISTIIPSGRARIEFHTDNSVSWTDYNNGYCEDEFAGIDEINYSVITDNSSTYSSNSFSSGNSTVAGRLGIGTITPATLLQMVGTTDLSPTTHGLMVLGATNASNIGIDQNEIMARTNGVASTLYLNHEGGNIVFNGTNTAGGNVGIGTSTPTSILSLGGTAARTFQMERNTTTSTAGQGLTISSGGAIAGTANLAGGDLTLKSGISTGTGTSAIHFLTSTAGASGSTDRTPSEKMTILGSGNVGIGTLVPARRLDIRGSDDGTPQIRLSGSAAPQYYWEFGEESLSTGDFFLDYMGSSGIKHPLRIKTSGYIGIGTTNPDALLTVNGTIHAKEVKIDLSGSFADYVFEKNYSLKPLSEVHLYIKDNGHLPDIPSAEDVKKNGMNVADMQVKLLQKVEELTLYAIDQQKRIEALEKELREVKNK
jgi:hypothetical protein